MTEATEGILLVDKGGGETSAAVVRKVKRLTGIRKVGHAGTLDPFATGLLVILLGQGTKLSPYLMAGDKAYRGTMRLGVETDTLDPTGRVIGTSIVRPFTREHIERSAGEFVGEVEQAPPAYSALKYEGKRAYAWAREGVAVPLKSRKVRILSLNIRSVDLPDIEFDVMCSSGTYIRSLAGDLGRKLGPGAHLKALRRVAIGPFSVDSALRSEELGRGLSREDVLRASIPLGEALPEIKGIQLDEKTARAVRNGHQPSFGELMNGTWDMRFSGHKVKLLEGRDLVAICDFPRDDRRECVRPKVLRVFH